MRLDRVFGLLLLFVLALSCQRRVPLGSEPTLVERAESASFDGAPDDGPPSAPSDRAGQNGHSEAGQSQLSQVQPAALYMPTGHRVLGVGQKLPVTLRNLKLAELLVAPVAAEDVHRFSRVLGTHPPDRDPLYSLPRGVQLDFEALVVSASNPEAPEETRRVDVFSEVPGDVALVVARAPGTFSRVALVQRGSLNVLMKLSKTRGLVWVTDGRSGKPVADSLVQVKLGEHQSFKGKTNRHGIVYLPSSEQLRKAPKDEAQDERGWHYELTAFASKDQKTGFTSEYWQTGLAPWEFGMAASYYSDERRLVGSVNTERGIYRAGDAVHILGVLRQRDGDGSLSIPRGPVEVTVKDAEQSPISTFETHLTRFGTFRSEVTLPKTATLGRYTIAVRHDDVSLYQRFKVAEYRPIRFEVKLGQPEREPLVLSQLRDDVVIPVEARFLYGAPVAGAKLQYSVSLRRDDPWGSNDYDGEYGYDEYTHEYEYGYGGTELVPLESEELVLNDDGKAEIRLRPDTLKPSMLQHAQRMRLIVEATALDATGESVSAHHSFAVFRNSTTVDVESKSWVVDAKKGWDVDVSVKGVDGKAASEAVELRLMRRQWVSAVYENGHGRRTSGHYDNRLVQSRSLSIHGTTRVHFALQDAGDYFVTAHPKGKMGQSVASVWAWGNGAYGRFSDHPRVDLHADKQEYEPGEDATLMVESPYERAWSLLTLEREGVLEAHVQELHGASDPLPVSLTRHHLPNVYASVAIVPPLGWGKTNLVGSPLRVGYRELKVSPRSRRLNVEVLPSREVAEPGQSVPVSVRVRDHEGKPVSSEVTLWAADDGVLQLTGYETPDIFSPAYPDSLLGVTTAASLVRLTPSEYEDETGGDGAGAPTFGMAMRSRFLDTAFFSQGVVTGADGTATLLVKLPDNLTRWRLVAAVADTKHRFGSADARLTARKQLQIEPVTPRFLTRGDHFELAVDVQNNSQQKRLARVELSSSELALERTQQEVELAARQRVTLHFPAAIGFQSEAHLRATVVAGDLHDGIDVSIPVHSASETLTNLVYEGPANAKTEVIVPTVAEAGSARLIVESGPREIVALSAAFEALVDYPHGCLEQTTSRLIPMAKLGTLLRGHPAFADGRHQRKMQAAVAHLLRNQNADGGFSLWPNGESKPFLTAYALWGLSIARESGLDVPDRVFTQALNYVRSSSGKVDGYGTIGGSDAGPFSHFVQTALGTKDPSRGERLWAESSETAFFTRALLSASQPKGDSATQRIRALFEQATPRGEGRFLQGVHDSGYDWAYGAEIRATSALALAASEHGEHETAASLIQGLLATRSVSGTWGTTQNNLWALMALSRHAEHSLPTSDSSVLVSVTGAPATRLRSTGSQPLARTLIDGLRAGTNAFTVESSSQRLSTVARLSYEVAVEHQRQASNGLTIRRRIVDAKTGKEVAKAKVGQLLRVELSVTTPQTRHQIALVDRVAAGVTPVDTELATARRSHRGSQSWDWVHRELHDERVSYFANTLYKGTHHLSYLARATHAGDFTLPAARVEAMYQPDVMGRTAPAKLSVGR